MSEPDQVSVEQAGNVAWAMAMECADLREGPDGERLAALAAELRERFGFSVRSDEREAAAHAQFSLAWWLVRHEQHARAIEVADELARQFARETDPAALLRIGDTLLVTAGALAFAGEKQLLYKPVTALALVAGGLLGVHGESGSMGGRHLWAAVSRRGRVVRLRGRRERLKRSVNMLGVLLARLDDDQRPAVRRLTTRARLHRAVAFVALGRLREARVAFAELFSLDDNELAAVLTAATPGSEGSYMASEQAAAHLVLGRAGDEAISEQTIAAARQILRHRR